MFSIRHGSDNCTIVDCSISIADKDRLLKEIDKQRKGKGVTRFISTHPDQDHLMGLVTLDDHIKILNFYVVNNSATKEDETDDFKRYKKLRDGDKAEPHRDFRRLRILRGLEHEQSEAIFPGG